MMKSNDTVKKLVVLFIAVGVGTFICNVLERTELNVWIARGTGALITIIVGFLISYCIKKINHDDA